MLAGDPADAHLAVATSFEPSSRSLHRRRRRDQARPDAPPAEPRPPAFFEPPHAESGQDQHKEDSEATREHAVIVPTLSVSAAAATLRARGDPVSRAAHRPPQRRDRRARRPRQDDARRRDALAVRLVPREPGRQRARASTRWTSSARRASRSSPRTRRSGSATRRSTSSTRPATPTSAARSSAR